MSNGFMFNNRSSGNQRKQRESEQVELRRVRNEEMLKRKREVQPNESTISFESAREKLLSSNLNDIYQGVYDFRIRLSIESNPPIQPVIDTGIIPRCISLLDPSFYSEDEKIAQNIRVEAAWVLTNIATGNSEQTGEIVKCGAIAPLVRMVNETCPQVVDQAVWALGNISGDCEKFRDIILQENALNAVIQQIGRFRNDSENIKILRNLIWLLANLNRGRSPPPKRENMLNSLDIIESVIISNDAEISSDCFWGSSYIADVDSDITDLVLNSPIIERARELLEALDRTFNYGGNSSLSKICSYSICPIVRLIGNIVSGSEIQTQKIINYGFLEFFSTLFYKYENKKLPRIRKEICWALSNVSAGTIDQVKYLFEKNLVPLLIDAVSNYELYVRKEAMFALCNIAHFTIIHTQYLQSLLDNKIAMALKMHLVAVQNNVEVQSLILDACRYLLEAGNKIRLSLGENPVVDSFIDEKLVDQIEDLQDSRNNSVSRKAYSLIVDFFEGEDEE